MIFPDRQSAERVIDPNELENLFAEGLTVKAIAKRMRINQGMLSRKMGNSQTLTDARERGQRRCSK